MQDGRRLAAASVVLSTSSRIAGSIVPGGVPTGCPSTSRWLVSAKLGEGGDVKAFGGVWLGVACIALFLAPAAQAKKLTVKKAEAALQPAADKMAPEVTPKIAALLPGATISKTRVKCEIAKKKQRADCDIEFSIVGATTG